MGIENRATYEASELGGKCPGCGERKLVTLSEERDGTVDNELLVTVAHCENCGREINILND